ncbi:tyrosine-type recombinase/integrase [Calidifontibacter sp. DB0510]|uniref:Tyrosine-type recombinase/integrase n=1 Tax=Metallococcus carri TaxID=1656884 RepID=A0A967B0C8_9MICO|nr:tyrosine-type recombinase/integrase [Metallococcus carri]NHN55747.1 tyrosine-type recombinase/integrase [Metallococcus carri]NOP38564.1 tyrosine-type recombinase/integrase [Calidifontibacter sp. DB2511S]
MTRGWEIQRWGGYLKATGRPQTTVEMRTYHLERLAADYDDPGAVTFDDLVEWLAAHEWAPNTRRSYRGSLRSYWSWRLATGRAAASPAHLLPPVRVPRGLPRPTPEDAYRAAIASASRDPRALMAIQLAAQCGLRRGEIARARREDLEPALIGYTLRVEGKGGHIRMVPLPDPLAATIVRAPAGWLFPSPHGKHLTPHHLGKIVVKHLPDGYTTHTLRHRCGTVSYGATRDLRAVQELLGHAKPETTAIYTKIDEAAVRAAMNAAAA